MHFPDTYLMLSVCRYYHAEAVMWAVGATAFVTLGITLFTSQSKVRSVTRSQLLLAGLSKGKFHELQQLSAVCGKTIVF